MLKTASLAAIPARVDSLNTVIERLLPQVDRVNVYLNAFQECPQFLLHPKITVARSQEFGDIGDAGKFFWASSVDGYHFTCDDDILYPLDYVERTISAIEALARQAVVGWHGSILQSPFLDYYHSDSRKIYSFRRAASQNLSVHLLGTGVMAYHTSTIKVGLQDFPSPNMADTWFGVLGQRQSVPFVQLAREEGYLSDVPGIEPADSIWSHSRRHSGSASDTGAMQTAVVHHYMPWRLHTPPTGRRWI
jgi:hypothetical protein